MKTAMRKGASRAIATLLSVVMAVGLLPAGAMASAASGGQSDDFARIVHLDMGRKYFSPESIKSLIDTMAASGYDQLELDFSNNEEGQFRFALSDMTVTYITYTYYTEEPTAIIQDELTPELPVNDVPAEETPAAGPEAPAESEEPAPEETPAESEEPAPEEAPAESEEPAPEETPAEGEEPAPEETPAEGEEPTPEETPAESQEPAPEESAPAAAEEADEIDSLLDTALSGVTTQTLGSGEAGALIIEYEQVPHEVTVDLTPALGEAITEEQMHEIITYANSKGIEIVPLLNSPGHMGAILSAVTADVDGEPKDYSYNGSNSLDITSEEARAFGMAVVEKYAAWFANEGCTTFNIGADEFANDIYSGGMGFGHLVETGEYGYFVSYVNELYDMLKSYHYETVRAFNDGFYYGGETDADLNPDIEICYWSSGWSGYEVASAETIAQMGHRMINTNGDYYYILGKNSVMTENGPAYAANFDPDMFQGASRSISADGAMFCIWCDYPNATEDDAQVITDVQPYLENFASTLPTVPVTDEATGVSVEAAGVTSMEVVQLSDGYAISGLNEYACTDYVAYEVTLNGGEYTDAASVTIPVDGLTYTNASQLRGFVVNSDGSVTMVSGTLEGTGFTFTAPHFSTVGVAVLAENTEDVYVSAGGSTTVSVPGVVEIVPGSGLDTGIAEVSVEQVTQPGGYYLEEVTEIESGGEYLIVNNRTGTMLTNNESWFWADTWWHTGLELNGTPSVNSDHLWTITSSGSGYTVQYTNSYNRNYLNISNRGAELDRNATLQLNYQNGSWTIAQNNNYLNDYGQNGIAAGYNNESGYAATDAGSQWTIYRIAQGTGDTTTTITFTGVSEGTTSVTIGETTYIIHVSPEDLTNVNLEVELWITNQKVHEGGETGNLVMINAAEVNSENGRLFSEIVPTENVFNANNDEVAFWKGTQLGYGYHQVDSGTDQTGKGNDFTYIRYWDDEWAFSDDGGEWTTYDEDRDQIVAYYLQVTDVTNEVTTEVVDWGNVPYTGLNREDFVLLDFAVKYESGERVPNSFPQMDKTIGFHCAHDDSKVHAETVGYGETVYYREIGMIRARETADYEVYMITITPNDDGKTLDTGVGSSSNNVRTYTYDGTEQVIWVDDEANLGDFANGPFADGYHVGGDATVPGLEIYERHAMLVTYYVRAKETEDSLTVHYIDATDGEENQFYSYNIAVTAGTLFDEEISLNTSNWKGPLVNGTVENIYDEQQTVSADLSTMPAIGADYRYRDYTCIRVERSADGKDVYLYYEFNEDSYDFVVDYGLPMTVTAGDLDLDMGSWDRIEVSGARYGTVEVGSGATLFTYTPTEILHGREQLTVSLIDEGEQGAEDSYATHIINIYPATTMYYEAEDQNFIDYSSDDWSPEGTSLGGQQATEALGGKENPYGSDPHYNGVDGDSDSNGASMKATVAQSETVHPTATFEFTGEAVDIIARTDNDAGLILVEIKESGSTSIARTYVVNNYFTETNEDADGLHQIPVLRVSADDQLTHGRYMVTIKVVPFGDPDGAQLNQGNVTSTNFYLDAIRVYNTRENTATYAPDDEAGPSFYEVGDLWLENTDSNEAVWIDGNETAGQSDYEDPGPNNEVYLAEGQSVTLDVSDIYDPDTQDLYLAARNMENGNTVQLRVNSGSIDVNGGSDQYYDITAHMNGTALVIENNSATRIALTTIKVTDKATPAGGN